MTAAAVGADEETNQTKDQASDISKQSEFVCKNHNSFILPIFPPSKPTTIHFNPRFYLLAAYTYQLFHTQLLFISVIQAKEFDPCTKP